MNITYVSALRNSIKFTKKNSFRSINWNVFVKYSLFAYISRKIWIDFKTELYKANKSNTQDK